MRRTTILAVMVSFVLSSAVLRADVVNPRHEHEGDIVVGRTSAGALAFEADLDEAIELSEFSGFGLFGWNGDEPGFDHLEDAEPDEDFYTLEEGVSVSLELVSADPAFELWGAGFSSGPFTQAGDQVVLGTEQLHSHVEWFVNQNATGFDSQQAVWTATFRLVETTGTYSASDDFSMDFILTPEPGSIALVLVGCVTLLRKRSIKR